jgi:hypothetical protein
VLKSGEIIGFQKRETMTTVKTTTVTLELLNASVETVPINLNALNGESITKDSVSGVV